MGKLPWLNASAVCLLDTVFKEGEDCELARFVNCKPHVAGGGGGGIGGGSASGVEQEVDEGISYEIAQAALELRGTCLAAAEIGMGLAEAPVHTITAEVTISRGAIRREVTITTAHAGCAVLMSVFDGVVLPDVARSFCQVYFDTLVLALGPAVPHLKSWGSDKEELTANLERVMAQVLPLAGSMDASSVTQSDMWLTSAAAGGAAMPSYSLTDGVSAALELALAELLAQPPGPSELAPDGARALHPLGACIVAQGRCVANMLSAPDAVNVGMALRFAGLLSTQSAPTDQNKVITIHVPVDSFRRTVAPHSFLVGGVNAKERKVTDTAAPCPPTSAVKTHSLVVAMEHGLLVCVLLEHQYPVDTVLSPHMKDACAACLFELGSSGVARAVLTQLQSGSAELLAGLTGTMTRSKPNALRHDSIIISTGHSNAVLAYLGLSEVSAALVTPLPPPSAVAPLETPWSRHVATQFERVVAQLRDVMTKMHEGRDSSKSSGPLGAGLTRVAPGFGELVEYRSPIEALLLGEETKVDSSLDGGGGSVDGGVSSKEGGAAALGVSSSGIDKASMRTDLLMWADASGNGGHSASVPTPKGPRDCPVGPETSLGVSDVTEVGMRFAPKGVDGSDDFPSYWVVGRRDGMGNEVYLALDNAVPEDVIDLAFRVRFGSM